MTITGFERPLTVHEARWAVEQAGKAPSIHNTQPWRFRWSGGTFELYADTSRVLSASDPDGREAVVSCGAALLNLRVALRKVGFDAKVGLLPDARDPRLLARVVATEASPATPEERKLYAALLRRQSHRGGFEERPVPSSVLVELQRAATEEGAELVYVHDLGQRRRVLELAGRAETALSTDDRVRAEIADWTPPPGSRRRDGVPTSAYEAEPRSHDDDLPARDFDQDRGQGSLRPTAPMPAGVIAMLATTGDLQRDWLMAGQALQRVLVTAAQHHVFAAVHSQLAEVSSLRNELRREFYDAGHPQLLLRLGFAAPSALTPRRPVADVLELT
jgi:hypothetical protein